MEWLWLCLAVIGLGLIWLLIMGMEKLAERLKEHDEARRLAAKNIAERTAQAEADFIEKEHTKASARDFIENGDFGDTSKPENAEVLSAAIDALTPEEFVTSMAKRIMGEPEGTDGIEATQSAFAQTPVRKVVAKGDGVAPVKVKTPRGKSALSKTEQKMLKKIKQGD